MQETIHNRTIFCGDNLDVLQGFNDESIDLIYLDPPFNKKKQFSAPIGSDAQGAEFKDWWAMADIKNAWLALYREKNEKLYQFLQLSAHIGDKSYKYYLTYMAPRLIEMHRILKPTGSIYLHCDSTMSHFLKMLLDVIFGYNNFRNEIVWHYRTGGVPKKDFARKHDTIFRYTKNYQANYYFDPTKTKQYYTNKPGFIDKHSGSDEHGFFNLVHPDDVFTIKAIFNMDKERVGYPTQKPLVLLKRIIEASCSPDGIVLDPFCGCATTCIAAEQLKRQWIGIDISKKAFELVNIRLKKEVELPDELYTKKVYYWDIDTDGIPARTDVDYKKLTGSWKKEVKQTLYGKQSGNCAGCTQHFHSVHFEIDHIRPTSKGGGDNIENLQLLCSYCNRIKGSKDMPYLRARLHEMRELL